MDPLKYVFDRPHLSRKIAKWSVVLSEYDIVYMTQKAVKGSAIADHLADNAIDDYESLKFDLQEEDVMAAEEDKGEDDFWKMYFDGAMNISRSGIGAVLISPEEKQFPVAIRLRFECTNNITEYEACINGLQAAIDLKVKRLKVYGDSALIIYQVKGHWQTKDPKLILYQKYLVKLTEKFEEVDFFHMTRDKNQFADALATLASMAKIDCETNVLPLKIEAQDCPAYCLNIEEEVDGKPWYHDIKRYIEK